MQTTPGDAMDPAILITRPQPAAGRFAALLRARLPASMPIMISPVMAIQPLPGAVPDLSDADSLLLTSTNALPALRGRPDLAGQTAYCVGQATARAAQDLGLKAVPCGGTADAMLARLTAEKPPGRLVYLRGEHVSHDLANELDSAGIETHEAIVYRQVAQELSTGATTLLHQSAPVVLPLFSPRSARLFFAGQDPTAPLHVAAISAKVANQVPARHAARLTVTAAPTGEAMLDAVVALASQAKRVESGNGAQ